MITRVDHLVIVVRDLDSATETYWNLLGRKPSWRGTHPQLGTGNALFKLDNTYVELLSPIAAGELAERVRARLERFGEGLAALAFGTDDMDGCVAMLRSRGLSPDDPTHGAGVEDGTGAKREWRSAFLPLHETRGAPLFVVEHRSVAASLAPAPFCSTQSAAVSAVDHVVVMTGDPEGCRELYGDKLGLRLAFDKSFEKRGIRLLFFRVGGLTVECAAPLAQAASGDSDRLWGISYRVPDVTAAQGRIASAGFDVSEVRVGHKPGTKVCTVRNNTCGVATLLIEASERPS